MVLNLAKQRHQEIYRKHSHIKSFEKKTEPPVYTGRETLSTQWFKRTHKLENMTEGSLHYPKGYTQRL